MKNPKSLLSAEEINRIETEGPGFGLDSNLVHVGEDEQIVFTLKGRAFFQYAIDFHRHTGNLAEIKTLQDLEFFQIDIEFSVIDTLKKKLLNFQNSRSNPNHDRAIVEAVVYGSPLQILDTLSKSLCLKHSGSNIHLLPQIKYGQLQGN